MIDLLQCRLIPDSTMAMKPPNRDISCINPFHHIIYGLWYYVIVVK
jgi:hypothetical protein